MAHHAQHARSPKTTFRTRVPLLGLTTAAGFGVFAAPPAHAADAPTGTAVDTAAQQAATSEIGGVQLYPLAGTPLDLLSNNLSVPVGGMDFSTFPVTGPLRDGLPLREVPVVGTLLP
jgi:hypothetical protein